MDKRTSGVKNILFTLKKKLYFILNIIKKKKVLDDDKFASHS